MHADGCGRTAFSPAAHKRVQIDAPAAPRGVTGSPKRFLWSLSAGGGAFETGGRGGWRRSPMEREQLDIAPCQDRKASKFFRAFDPPL
jgi:hypothetical protein